MNCDLLKPPECGVSEITCESINTDFFEKHIEALQFLSSESKICIFPNEASKESTNDASPTIHSIYQAIFATMVAMLCLICTENVEVPASAFADPDCVSAAEVQTWATNNNITLPNTLYYIGNGTAANPEFAWDVDSAGNAIYSLMTLPDNDQVVNIFGDASIDPGGAATEQVIEVTLSIKNRTQDYRLMYKEDASVPAFQVNTVDGQPNGIFARLERDVNAAGITSTPGGEIGLAHDAVRAVDMQGPSYHRSATLGPCGNVDIRYVVSIRHSGINTFPYVTAPRAWLNAVLTPVGYTNTI